MLHSKKKPFQWKANRPLADSLRFILHKFEHIIGGVGGCLGSISLNMSDVGKDFKVRSKFNKFEHPRTGWCTEEDNETGALLNGDPLP